MQNEKKVFIYDTTLRDGSQKKGISYSLLDKLAIVERLNEFGIDYIEGGWPGSNPKDQDFFKDVSTLGLKSKVVAFGSTRKKDMSPCKDNNLKMLIAAKTPAVALVGKSWTLHVEKILETTLTENLRMIEESVEYCKSADREVVYDAEHFFDGYINNREYALETLEAATRGGADWLVLCDTNGGTMPSLLGAIVKEVYEHFSIKIGIHAHNDCELAVANSLEAVRQGARQVQGTINGYGERCGNANLISVIPNLQLKMGFECFNPNQLEKLASLSYFVSDRANLVCDSFQPYVGSAAFAHKGGIHVAAIEKCKESYEHIDPKTVGNIREIIVSELSGKGNMRMLAKDWGLRDQIDLDAENPEERALSIIKSKENEGYQFEGAEGSVELIMRKMRHGYQEPFKVTDYVVVSEKRVIKETENLLLEGVQAIIKLNCNGDLVHTAADGDGPIHALDLALRKALIPTFPFLALVKLVDYKVRILDPETATSAMVRVVVEATMGNKAWSTTGCGRNVISASFEALIDSLTLVILRENELKRASSIAV